MQLIIVLLEDDFQKPIFTLRIGGADIEHDLSGLEGEAGIRHFTNDEVLEDLRELG